MATVGPLLVLALLEAVLGVGGFGHPTSFFVRKQLGGRGVLVENGWFGLRFFPPALARSPSPIVIEAEKPAGLYRIFLFGESAAMGDPRPAFGVGRYLETLLRERFPDEKFEVVCAAMTAINSHAILPIARECARYQGDLWIVYMGNNEFLGPFGGSGVFGAQAPRNAWVRSYLALQRTRTGQWLVALTRRLSGSRTTPANWGGMKMFLDQQIPPGDPRRERIYANFRQNLEDIIQAGRRAGVPIILSSIACNLKDCAPFGSVHVPTLDGSKLGEWERVYQAGVTNAEHGNPAESIRGFEEATRLSPNYADAYFRLGQSILAVTNFEAARRSFGQARDLDSLPFRADSKINSLIAEAARRYSGQGVIYLDAEGALVPMGSGQIPGEECFYEHVHLNFEGNYRLARALAERVLTCLPASVLNHQRTEWAGREVCARDLGLTDWNRCTVLEEIGRRLADAPFSQQLNHNHQVQKLAGELAECRLRQQPGAVEKARRTYEEALQKDPDEHWLHHNYAEFLAAIGDLAGATEQMQIVRELAPEHHAAYLQLGRLLARQQKSDEARQWLEKALGLRPDVAELYVELGQVCSSQGRLEEALRQYGKARTWHLDDARVCLLEAEVLEKQQKRSEAIGSLRDAIRLRPSYWEARDHLGMELGLRGEFSEAAAEFEQVVRLQPDYAEGHLNLGIALARQGSLSEALEQFQTALRLEPGNAKAREFITRIDRLSARGSAP
ncbi:MAG: tetratricopeptide repeat protein [Limisphaerales bacterium]